MEKYSYFSTPDSNVEFKEMESEIPFVDDKVWSVLCTKVKALSGVEVEASDDHITVSRQDCKTDGFTFALNHTEPNDEIDFSELYGMSREEAVNYLQNSESFDYDYLYISAGDWILDIEPDSDAFDCMLQEIIVALKQEDDLIEKAIEDSEKALEARKEADKEKKYSHDKIYLQLLDDVRAELKKLGWEGDFRVFTSRNYNILWCLSLRISPVSECYFSGTPEDILANITVR